MIRTANQMLARASEKGISWIGGVLRWLAPGVRGVAGSWQPPGWLRVTGGLGLAGWNWTQPRLALLLMLALLAGAAVAVAPTATRWW